MAARGEEDRAALAALVALLSKEHPEMLLPLTHGAREMAADPATPEPLRSGFKRAAELLEGAWGLNNKPRRN